MYKKVRSTTSFDRHLLTHAISGSSASGVKLRFSDFRITRGPIISNLLVDHSISASDCHGAVKLRTLSLIQKYRLCGSCKWYFKIQSTHVKLLNGM